MEASEQIRIDGSAGEGGGQILRSALALSVVTGRPLRIDNIRRGRKKPGLQRQHLTAVNAAAAISSARTEGAALGSTRLSFAPGTVIPGEYRFQIGTAGSATLVLQTVLPALITASGPSTLDLEGGTHNPWAPPFDFLDRAFLPCLRRMGARVHAALERPGFFPAGGGRFRVVVEPARHLERIDIPERGAICRRTARALVAHLPLDIGHREIETVRELLDWDRASLRVEEVTDSDGPGNALVLEIGSENITEVFTGFGERGVPAELVAKRVAGEARRYLASGVPVGEHLADQLLLPMALAGGGSFRTVRPSRHTTTNIDVIRAFLPVAVRVEEKGRDDYIIYIIEMRG